jgi:glutamate/tyrosine decarboxylase-like PLP-dependent enzyme
MKKTMPPEDEIDLNAPMNLDPHPDQMRALGYRVVDLIVDHRSNLERKPAYNHKSRAELDVFFREELPRAPSDPMEILDRVARHGLTAIGHVDHPRFFGYVPGPGSFVGAMADALSAGYNVFAGNSFVASGPAAIEAETLKWLRTLMGFPQSAAGIFLSGGSMANLTALHTARARLLKNGQGHDETLVVYGTSQGHSSIGKALRILGFSQDQFRNVPTDNKQRMDCGTLRSMIETDKAAGRTPWLVAATAGSTNTGAIDPLENIRTVCDSYKIWMHVDGAYGAAAVFDSSSKPLLKGIESADSLVLDPHKWWFQPFEIGCVLIRDGHALREAFSMEAEYLREAREIYERSVQPDEQDPLTDAVNFYDMGPQLTRSFRALKLWMFIQTNGADRIARMVTRGVKMAEAAEAWIDASHDWRIATPACIGTLTFRPRDKAHQSPDRIKRAVDSYLKSGFGLITTTELNGEKLFRLCCIHPASRLDDITESLKRLAVELRNGAA